MGVEIKTLYECGSCNEVHELESAAEDCCRPEVNEVYACPVCEDTHDTTYGAERCCDSISIESPAESCPKCSRDYDFNELGYHAIQVAGHCQTCNPFFTLEQQGQIEDQVVSVLGVMACDLANADIVSHGRW